MKTTSLASTFSRILLATVVLPDPVPPLIPIIISSTQSAWQPGNHSPQKFGESVPDTIPCLHNLFMVDGLVADPGRHVRNARDPEHIKSGLTSHNRFRYSAHTYGISAESSKHVYLSWSFVTWTRKRSVDTAPHFNSHIARLFNHNLLQHS